MTSQIDAGVVDPPRTIGSKPIVIFKSVVERVISHSDGSFQGLGGCELY